MYRDDLAAAQFRITQLKAELDAKNQRIKFLEDHINKIEMMIKARAQEPLNAQIKIRVREPYTGDIDVVPTSGYGPVVERCDTDE